jgi:uncharacterized HAD superfamily protein
MNKKEEYINTMLLENIEIATKSIKETYEELEEIRELPNDCTGILIDGFVCENPDMKIDLLTNLYHVIGYMECLRAQSTELLNLRTMNDDEFEKYLIEQEEIKKHNDLEMQKIQDMIQNRKDNLNI